MIDFTNCKPDLTATYGGSDQKWGIYYNNNRYMVKTPDKIDEGERIDLNTSYSNSVISEYLCCHIFKIIGFETQETILGYYNNGKEQKPVVACKNFITDENRYKLIEFKDIENNLLNKKPPKIPHLTDIYEILTKDTIYFSKEEGLKALDHYWDCFIVDALLGNFDRHANNWGYIMDKSTEKIIGYAPIYDCGSCLYPKLSETALDLILNDEKQIEKRVDTFPNAALIVNDKKVNYKTFLFEAQNKECNNALIRVTPKINIESINDFINNLEGISDLRKQFYKTMIAERYEKIILPAYEKVLNLQLEHNNDIKPDTTKQLDETETSFDNIEDFSKDGFDPAEEE